MPTDEGSVGRLKKKRLEKEIKELQKQFFGVVKTKDMKKLVAISEKYGADPQIVEGIRKSVRTNKDCEEDVEIPEKLDNTHTA